MKQEFLDDKSSPSFTFEQEKEVLESPEQTEKLKKCMEDPNFIPHSARVFFQIKGEKAKTFPLRDLLQERLFKVNPNLLSFLFKKHFENEFFAFKPTDRKKYERLFEALLDQKMDANTEQFECNVIHLTYCPMHEKIPFFEKNTKKCSCCNTDIDYKNCKSCSLFT